MSLFLATLLMGLLLSTKGLALLLNPTWLERRGRYLFRSNGAAILLFGGAALWFLWHISHLNEADFGAYRGWLLILFGFVAILSFFYVKDFLAIRGLAILVLLLSKELLDAAYMEEALSRLFLVLLVYGLILIAMYLGVMPYKMRDFHHWLFARRIRVRSVATITLLYGFVLLASAFIS